MKSAISACLVTALCCSTIATAGSPPHKTSRGSNRVTCYVKIDHTETGEKDSKHDKRGGKDEIESTRTVSIYGWSFLWNYIIINDCPNITAHLSSLIPLLGRDSHDVKCQVEIG
ncbi:hypothetical protein VTH82DRAFT_1118 [Thermothelomyces myriococcoides]